MLTTRDGVLRAPDMQTHAAADDVIEASECGTKGQGRRFERQVKRGRADVARSLKKW